MNEFSFTEKYRPLFLTDILGNTSTVLALNSLTTLPNMLFYGPPGTGKTTAIRALCRKFYKTNSSKLSIPNVIELNASDERGIQTVRETIKKFAETVIDGRLKLVILDEADSMSRDAQNALRRVIEDFSGNCRFCLIANYANKIIPAIQSRCSKFRFGPIFTKIFSKQMSERVKDICEKEKIEFTESGIETLLLLSCGDARKLINDIEGVHKTFGLITEDSVYKLCNSAPNIVYEDLFKQLLKCKFDEMVKEYFLVAEKYSLDCAVIAQNLGECVRKSSLTNKMSVLKELAGVEKRSIVGNNQKVHGIAVCGVFFKLRD